MKKIIVVVLMASALSGCGKSDAVKRYEFEKYISQKRQVVADYNMQKYGQPNVFNAWECLSDDGVKMTAVTEYLSGLKVPREKEFPLTIIENGKRTVWSYSMPTKRGSMWVRNADLTIPQPQIVLKRGSFEDSPDEFFYNQTVTDHDYPKGNVHYKCHSVKVRDD